MKNEEMVWAAPHNIILIARNGKRSWLTPIQIPEVTSSYRSAPENTLDQVLGHGSHVLESTIGIREHSQLIALIFNNSHELPLALVATEASLWSRVLGILYDFASIWRQRRKIDTRSYQ